MGAHRHLDLVGRGRADPQSRHLECAAPVIGRLVENAGARGRRDGITFNIVLPGRIATGRITFLDEQKAKRENRSIDDIVTESTGSIPLGRYGRPEEYGNVVTFLASEPASYLTGSVIRVDGGMIQSI